MGHTREPKEEPGSFRFRFLLAILLFLCYVALDREKLSFAHLSSQGISQMIQHNIMQFEP